MRGRPDGIGPPGANEPSNLEGTDEADVLDGGNGPDRLEGGEGDDTLKGGNGPDRLEGDEGADTLDGGNGPDRLEGGEGDDVLTGGRGADVFISDAESGADTITDFFAPIDKVFFETDDDSGEETDDDADDDADDDSGNGNGLPEGVAAEARDGGVVLTFGESSVMLEGASLDDVDSSNVVVGSDDTGDDDEPDSDEDRDEDREDEDDEDESGEDGGATDDGPPAFNAILTMTGHTPESFGVGTGLIVKLAGNSADKTINVPDGSGVAGVRPGAALNIEGSSDSFTYARNGTTLEIKDAGGNLVASINAGPQDTTTVRFTDGSAEVGVEIGAGGAAITFGGQNFARGDSVDGAETALELDSSDTSADVFSGNSSGADSSDSGMTRDLDGQGSLDGGAVELDAGGEAVTFTDSVATANNVEIVNFGSDDALVFDGVTDGPDAGSDVTVDDIRFSESDGNTQFEIDDGSGNVSLVTLVGVTTGAVTVSGFNADSDTGDVSLAS